MAIDYIFWFGVGDTWTIYISLCIIFLILKHKACMLDTQMAKKENYVSHFTMHTYMYAHRHTHTHTSYLYSNSLSLWAFKKLQFWKEKQIWFCAEHISVLLQSTQKPHIQQPNLLLLVTEFKVISVEKTDKQAAHPTAM